jgi:hypothetical protein
MSATTTTAAVAGGEVAALLAELREIAEEARETFGGLSARQLNWQPAAGRWGVGQCFEHLVKTNRAVLPALERVARGEHRMTLWERLSPFSGLFARVLLKTLAPGSARKVKAPRGVRPSGGEVDARVIATFAAQQGELAELIARAAQAADLKRTVVTSPLAKFVTYTLGDALRILVAHERRHFEQARRVTEAEGFPHHARGRSGSGPEE